MLRRLAFFLCVLTAIRPQKIAPQTCYQCATPGLRDNWYATSLPKIPEGLEFTDKCLDGVAIPGSGRTCNGKCFELVFPLEGRMEAVRGCYSEFIEKGVSETPPDRCEYKIGKEDAKSPVSLGGGSTALTSTSPVTVMRICAPKQGAINVEGCNRRFIVEGVLNDEDQQPLLGKPAAVTGACGQDGVNNNTVLAKTDVGCLSCLENGHTGDCGHKADGSCKDGAYCAKISGKIGKNDYIVRGCIPVSPFFDDTGKAVDVCFDLNNGFKTPFLLGITDDNSFSSDSKMCICTTERCNSAWAAAPLLASLLSLLSLLPFLR